MIGKKNEMKILTSISEEREDQESSGRGAGARRLQTTSVVCISLQLLQTL